MPQAASCPSAAASNFAHSVPACEVRRRRSVLDGHHHVLPRLGPPVGHQVGLLIKPAVRSEVVSRLRVVASDCDRGPTRSIGCERTRRRRLNAAAVYIPRRRNLDRSRRRRGCTRWRALRRSGRRLQAERQWRSLDGAKDAVAHVDSLIWWDPLRNQVGVQRIWSKSVLAHRQRLVRLVAIADLDSGCALSGVAHAGVVAGAANRAGGILWQLAIKPVGGVHLAGVGGRPPRRWWQEPHRARRLDLP